MPGEVTPAHRHSQSALRFVPESSAAHTGVHGEQIALHPGNFVLTPARDLARSRQYQIETEVMRLRVSQDVYDIHFSLQKSYTSGRDLCLTV
jgi:gentisate 1,2-dioxygenase